MRYPGIKLPAFCNSLTSICLESTKSIFPENQTFRNSSPTERYVTHYIWKPLLCLSKLNGCVVKSGNLLKTLEVLWRYNCKETVLIIFWNVEDHLWNKRAVNWSLSNGLFFYVRWCLASRQTQQEKKKNVIKTCHTKNLQLTSCRM